MFCSVAPAKINLYLCILGPRADGFHALESLVVPLQFGDEVELSCIDADADALDCNVAALSGPDNLVLRALTLFRVAFPPAPKFAIKLIKRIPVGAGLGGGSSDAATILNLANAACGKPLANSVLLDIAARLGSDCALFVKPQATFVCGRGEMMESASDDLASGLSGLPVLVFKPPFPVATAWAYRCLSQRQNFSSAAKARELRTRWQSWQGSDGMDAGMLYNDFEPVIAARHLALKSLLQELRTELASPLLLSGSGSACFVINPDRSERIRLQERLQSAFGDAFFWVETWVSGNDTCSGSAIAPIHKCHS